MLKNVLIVIAVVIAIVLIYASTKPDTFSVTRSVNIKAGADVIFTQIVDFNRWAAWSPWEKLDPAMNRKLSGAATGAGAVYEWNGNKKVGQGRMEITSANAPQKIVIKLDFIKPFAGHNVTAFTLNPQADGSTDVIWEMHGPNVFMGKVMSVFMDMDKMIGGDFDRGLLNLKQLTESKTAQTT